MYVSLISYSINVRELACLSMRFFMHNVCMTLLPYLQDFIFINHFSLAEFGETSANSFDWFCTMVMTCVIINIIIIIYVIPRVILDRKFDM